MVMPDTPVFVGCDVGKHDIAVFISEGERAFTISNTPKALARFARELPPDSLVICEATGGYEAALLAALVSAERACHRADARKVKAFIRSLGTLAKTDNIDARALARYGAERHDRLTPWRPADKAQQQLQALVMMRRELVASRVAWNNRSKAPGSADLAKLLAPILATFKAQLAAIDQEIAKLVAAGPLAQRAERLIAIPGIGSTTAYALLALMPELGSMSRRQAASLAGLAPHPKQSGQRDAYRRVRGGRPAVRNTIFMAALSATRFHPQISEFYKRLRAAGKKPIVATTAAMRKLIVIANATLKLS